MIGRRVSGRKKVAVSSAGSAEKTLAFALRSNTSSCAYALSLIVDEEYKTLQECVLQGIINPVVLMYSVMNNSSFVMTSVLEMYTGGTTNTTSYPDFAVILSLKKSHTYSGIQLYSKASLTSVDRGLELYLFDGELTTTLSDDINVLDVANRTTAAYTLSNIINNSELTISAIPKPDATVYKHYAGNSLVRGAHDSEAMINGDGNIGRCDIFGTYWLEGGPGEFIGASYRLTSGIAYEGVTTAIPRVSVRAGTYDYPFARPLLFS